jgi:hypothetical protein
MQLFVILVSIVSVAAFAPASRMAGSVALKMGFEVDSLYDRVFNTPRHSSLLISDFSNLHSLLYFFSPHTHT